MTTNALRRSYRLALLLVGAGLLFGRSPAAASPSADPSQSPPQKATTQAASANTPAPAPDLRVLAERVTALEKENLVLREDLGRAQLELRLQLEEAAKRQAEATARLQQKIDQLDSQLAAERAQQARRQRNLWLAVGVLALGLLASN